VADAVHDEYPASHHVELMKTFLVKAWSLIGFCHFAAIETSFGEVRMADLVTWAFAAVAPNFPHEVVSWST
jgi:hypothetical protein